MSKDEEREISCVLFLTHMVTKLSKMDLNGVILNRLFIYDYVPAPIGHGIEFICQFANNKRIKAQPENISSNSARAPSISG